MNEKLLQYLWNFKIFSSFDFKDVTGTPLEILNFGQWNFNSGADFLDAKIKSNGLIFAGNIELHVKSSDWIFHQHSGNIDFDNLILHVVFQHDVEIAEFTVKNIPTLELCHYIKPTSVEKYKSLVSENQFIACEHIFDSKKIPFNFSAENLLKKLDEKSIKIQEQLVASQNDYEAVLFQNLAYAFGLHVNAEIFQQFTKQIDFKILNKIRQNQTQLEALFFGMFGWLESPLDEQTSLWSREFNFLKIKYQLQELHFKPKFLRLRPPNFPTIRLSQLAHLYSATPNLFSKIMGTKSTKELVQIFKKVKASKYWENHFNFGKISANEYEKSLTEEFINLILINAVLPLKYHYHKHVEEGILDEILQLYSEISAEKNSVLTQWKNLGVFIKTALDSQAYLYHYKNFCLTKKCLNCSIGLQLLKS